MNQYTKALSEDVREKLFNLQELVEGFNQSHTFTEGNYLDFCRLMVNDEGKGLYSQIIKMIELLNGEGGILRATRTARNSGNRITRAQILERANNPEDLMYTFCPKCSRPMMRSYMKQHQRDSFICREVKIGRIATQEIGNRLSARIGHKICNDLPHDENDSDVEDQDIL
tara:strand:- start:60 stop:569 length:510 start_codon:yes stop_codon:yes gene_type:complete